MLFTITAVNNLHHKVSYHIGVDKWMCIINFNIVKCFVFVGFPLRLADGNNVGEGRVEIFFDNSWATVCDDGWDNTDATVVCKQLGFSTSGSAVSLAGFGEGSGTILLDSVSCSGNDSNIFDCPHVGFKNHNCSHRNDAGVICRDAPSKYYCFYSSLVPLLHHSVSPFLLQQNLASCNKSLGIKLKPSCRSKVHSTFIKNI